jgi:hypothetical protein
VPIAHDTDIMLPRVNGYEVCRAIREPAARVWFQLCFSRAASRSWRSTSSSEMPSGEEDRYGEIARQ